MVETSYMEGQPGLSTSPERCTLTLSTENITSDLSLMTLDHCQTNQSIDQTANITKDQTINHPFLESEQFLHDHQLHKNAAETHPGQEYFFEPTLFSDVTIHYQLTSYHVHATVLYTASKFFNVLLGSQFAPNNHSVNDCDVTSRCTRHHHRCIHFEGTTLGGASITGDDFYEFLVHLYAHVDGTSPRGKRVTPTNKQSNTQTNHQTSDKLPKFYYIARITNVDVARDIVTYQCYGYDQTTEQNVTGGSILVSGQSVKATTQCVGSWIFSLAVVDSPNYHLAYYFECESLMYQYQMQAESIFKHAASTSLFFPIWKLLRLADRYHWHSMRAACLELCLKDKNCASRAGWHALYKTLDPNTSAELFSMALKR